ncbi:MAG TPA: phosphopantetheine-binding protein, partial [Candidatus Angelobacter sp.]|nr:phosphopantetheine-binding protein [Candidatus Angelobacter sp.]
GEQTRRGAVSSFGFSGTNAHLIIEEPPAVERVRFESPGYVVVLSARTGEQLKQQAQNLLGLLKRDSGLSMNDLSYTLFVGRMHMACRLACVARDQKELTQLLEQWMETGAASQVYAAEIPESRVRENVSLKKFGNYCIRECGNGADAASYLENLAAIAELYVKGYALDFRALFPQNSRRIPLPTYPFARERYWVETGGAATAHAQPAPQLMPHANTSNQDDGAAEAVMAPRWLFSMEPSPTNGHASRAIPMAAEEKLELFLKQETALQLHRPIEEIPVNMSYFDLGLTSLAITTIVHRINRLLDVTLSPSALFEQKDIQSLAEYLLATYPSKIDALNVSRQEVCQIQSQGEASPAASVPLHEQAEVTSSGVEENNPTISEEVWWQEVSLNNGHEKNNGYEKVTF